MAVAFSFVAAIPLTALGLFSLGKALFGYPPTLGPGEWLLTVLAVFASYALAALLAGIVFALSRPIRSTFIGSMLVGALMTPLIYGSIVVMSTVLWEPAGRILFGDRGTTRAEFARDIPQMLIIFAIVGLVAGPAVRSRWRE